MWNSSWSVSRDKTVRGDDCERGYNTFAVAIRTCQPNDTDNETIALSFINDIGTCLVVFHKSRVCGSENKRSAESSFAHKHHVFDAGFIEGDLFE